MSKQVQLTVAVLVAAGALALWLAVGRLDRSPAQDKAPAKKPAADDKEAKSDDAKTAVRKTAEAFVQAFNKGDAKALAAFWTKDGEYVGLDGEVLRGRDAIEKDYAEFFKKNPKAKAEIKVESVRPLGLHTAVEEGTLKVQLPGEKEPGETRYSALHVLEEGGWKMASVREWVPSPAERVSLKDVDWLIGSWVARTEEGEVRTVYEWDENKTFLRCRYTVKREGKVISSGTQIIAKDPTGELRSWLFDSSGSFGESSWSRDGNRWILEATGTLSDGSELTAINILIPLGKDAFTWQSTERSAGGVPLPDVPPVKVTRVKADK